MKNLPVTALAALLLVGVNSAQARMESCDRGSGYWEEITRNVRVCDRVMENYTVTKRHCGYSGMLQLGHLWNKPDFYLPSVSVKSVSSVLNSATSCPLSTWETESGTYWYTRSDGSRSVDWYSYSGSLNLVSDQLKTTNHIRTVETNCRTEQKTVRVWRCGFEP
ncbi:hypothetical protein [Pseudoalteromonas aurantia]|uniref:C-type lectin domain-containing protein n=1 Tax=Pseudoalteromonas aurantia 208 TaxID=1314867 RepID=A0ABR9E5Y5_9GAMM|nr:hypothetical protein [Pseudoalteromonas aurantia]MBE0366405.1 hypothetical protein [Pseudoalteromonas aurantia 208]